MSVSSSITRTRRLSRRSIRSNGVTHGGRAPATGSEASAISRAVDRPGERQALSEMRESRERRRDTAGLHLPDVLALKINDPLGAGAELRHRQSLLFPEVADPLPHLPKESRLSGDVRVHPRRHTNSTISPRASSPYAALNMARECSRPPKRTSFFGAAAAVKQLSTFGVARSESRSAHTNSLRPLSFFESSSGTAATGAEMATRHSTSPSKLDASTALPPIEDPTRAISFTPRARKAALAARRSATGVHGLSGR